MAAALALLLHALTSASAADGFFTAANRNGVWWLVGPRGDSFFSFGVNVISPGPAQDRYNAARPEYAAWQSYPSTQAWADATVARLRRWNFNTVGGWPDRLLQRGALPYVEVLHLGAEEGVPWNDLFADSFVERMDRLVAARVAPHRDDAALLGWFTDNELAWYPDLLLTYHASQPAESATRRRLIQLLRDHYGNDFVALRRDFELPAGVNDFERLEQGGGLKLIPGGAYQNVVDKFTEQLADQYYRVTGEALRRHDPHHLVLGDRYHGHCPDSVAKAAGRHVDVISTNYDWPHGVDGYLPRFYLRRLHALSGRPVMVTEYYSAAAENRSGNKNTGELFVVVADQQNRAAVVERRLAMFADEPFVVGAHWFAFADEPPGGRASDGEDYNFGLVDIHDQPYSEVTNVMRRAHQAALVSHGEAGRGDGTASGISPTVPALPNHIAIERVEALLLSQAEVKPDVDAGLADLIAGWNADAIFLTLAGNHCVMADAYAGAPKLASEGLAWKASVTPIDRAQTATFQVKMLGAKAEMTEGAAPLLHWQRGVRFGATLAVPPSSLGQQLWSKGEQVRLEVELRDERCDRASKWTTVITLTEGAANSAALVTRQNGDQKER